MKQSGLLLWFFAVATVFGQPDSKIFVLKNSLLQESDKREIVNLLNELAWEYRQINLDSSLYYAQNGLRIAIEFLYLEGQADSWNRIGNAWEAVGNYEESKNAYMRALSIDQQIGIPYGIGRDNHQIGVVLAKSANLEEALEFELKSIKILENSSSERKDSLALGNIYNSTGGIFIDLAEYREALKYFRKGLSLRESLKDTIGISKSYNEIALVYESVKLFQTALRYHNKSLHYSERISYLPGQATSYQNIGNIYSSLGGLDTALAFYQKSLDIKTSLSNREDHEDLIHNIGILHLRNGDYQNARNNLNQSLEFRIEIENPIKLADSYYQLGLVHYDEENYQEALLNFIEAIRINPKRTNLTLRALVLEKIANSYILLGDSIKAVRYFLQYENLTDSLSENELMAIEFDSQLQASQHNLVLSKKELDLQVSKSENKTLYIFLLLGGAFLLFLFMLNARNNQRAVIAEKDIEIKDKEIDDLLRDQELSLITAVLNGQDEERQKIATDLHDRLGGILSVVKLHFKTLEKSISKLEERSLEQYEIANKLLNDATTTVREISHDIGDSLLLNLGLIPAVEDLAYSIKSSKQVSVNVLNHGIEARLPIKMEINIYKVIQEAFSNILKHAEAENITLNFIKSEDTISITIEDDGAGFNLDSGASREGLGMLSMRSRVEEFNGRINFDSHPGHGTTITIEIPNNSLADTTK